MLAVKRARLRPVVDGSERVLYVLSDRDDGGDVGDGDDRMLRVTRLSQ